MSPFFSIVTVVYNAGATFEQTIVSVARQSFSDYEYIVVDGGSGDNTLDIANKHKGTITQLISEPDKGIYDAMNKGLRCATGQWLFFLGADDVFYEDDTLQKISSHLKDKRSIYYGNAYFKSRKKLYDGKFSKFKLALRNICHQSVFYPADILSNHLFNLKYKFLSDYALNLKLYKAYQFRYFNLCVSMFNDSASSANSIDDAFENDKLQLVKENLGWVPYLYAKTRRVVKTLVQ